MKRLSFTFIGIIVSIAAMAVPAMVKPIQVAQPDGTMLTVYLRGDETFSFYEDLEGNVLTADAQGFLRKASYYEEQTMRETWKERIQRRNDSYNEVTTSPLLRKAARKAFSGNRNALVILVNFSDVQMSEENTQVAFDDQFNKEGYSLNEHVGSVRDYYRSMSYGKFTIDFDVVGPYTLGNTLAYYGAKSGSDNDTRPATMIADAVKLADNDVDFSQYDWDKDGYVDQILVIFAGYSQAQGGGDDCIYPHAWTLSAASSYGDGEGAVLVDGVYVNRYACSSELKGSSGTTMDGICTACHEFSHTLGLKDTYDTQSAKCYGLGFWDLMCYGVYNGDNSLPAGYTAFERWQCGWLTPVELSSPKKITDMPALIDTAVAYVIYNDNYKQEYYLLENRQMKSFDAGCLGAGGLLVTHIDYDESAWSSSKINVDTNHQRYAVVAADNDYTISWVSSAKDVYPYGTINKALTDSSTPAATLFHENKAGTLFLNKPIEKVTMSFGKIGFTFMGGKELGIPTATEASNFTKTSFQANWTAATNADSYTIELQKQGTSGGAFQSVLTEEFANVTEGYDDISTILDQYTSTSGWTGSEVYPSDKRVGVGLIGAGTLTTPALTAPEDGKVQFTIKMAESLFESVDITVSVKDLDGAELASESFTSGDSIHTSTFTGITKDFKVTIATAKIVYISYVDVKCTSPGITTTTVEGVTATSYIFTDIDFTTKYAYRVKAVMGAYTSDWSNLMEVTVPTGIGDVDEKSLTPNPSPEGEGGIYNLAGQRINEVQKGFNIVNGKKIIKL